MRPYLDGLIGFNYLFTKTTIKNASNNEEVASSTNFDDTTMNYGGGGGLMFVVYKGKPAETPRRAGCEGRDDRPRGPLHGRRRGALPQEGVDLREEGRVRYRVSESRTDLLTFRIGVAVEF